MEVGFAAGGLLDEGEEVKAREGRVGEEMGREFDDVLRRGEISAKIEVRRIETDPKKASEETTELRRRLTQEREATWVEGGQKDSRRSPTAVPRTRRSTSEVREWSGPGMEREEGDHISFGTGLTQVAGENAKWTGQKVQVV
jgi:hypothetical protein